ncbi:MAG: KH domain-containing protein [bacterium]
MKELVEYVAKSLVDSPDKVEVKEIVGESVTIIEVKADPADVGKIIGREGRIANAIRTIAKASAAKQNKKVSVEIITEDKEVK